MWQHLLDLLAAARRPLAFVDFETAGLGGAPPCELAVAYWAPWLPPEQDDASRRARALAPPGLTYAATMRVDPCVPIHPDATRVHGIKDAEVRGLRRYDDIEVRCLFLGLAAGNEADGEGPAVWAGHNIAEADIPWMRTWGYLSSTPSDVVDTCRLARRLTADHPMPLAPDAPAVTTDPTSHPHSPPMWMACPAVAHGLAPYRDTLGGLHTALFGDPHEGGHGALADVCASARCLAAMLALWEPLWPGVVESDSPARRLDRLVGVVAAPPNGACSWDGWLRRDPSGKVVWGRKARKVGSGAPLDADRKYAQWVASLPSEPTGRDGEAWCSAETRAALGKAGVL